MIPMGTQTTANWWEEWGTVQHTHTYDRLSASATTNAMTNDCACDHATLIASDCANAISCNETD